MQVHAVEYTCIINTTIQGLYNLSQEFTPEQETKTADLERDSNLAIDTDTYSYNIMAIWNPQFQESVVADT